MFFIFILLIARFPKAAFKTALPIKTIGKGLLFLPFQVLFALIRAEVFGVNGIAEIEVARLGINLFLLLHFGKKLEECLSVSCAINRGLGYSERSRQSKECSG